MENTAQPDHSAEPGRWA